MVQIYYAYKKFRLKRAEFPESFCSDGGENPLQKVRHF